MAQQWGAYALNPKCSWQSLRAGNMGAIVVPHVTTDADMRGWSHQLGGLAVFSVERTLDIIDDVAAYNYVCRGDGKGGNVMRAYVDTCLAAPTAMVIRAVVFSVHRSDWTVPFVAAISEKWKEVNVGKSQARLALALRLFLGRKDAQDRHTEGQTEYPGKCVLCGLVHALCLVCANELLNIDAKVDTGHLAAAHCGRLVARCDFDGGEEKRASTGAAPSPKASRTEGAAAGSDASPASQPPPDPSASGVPAGTAAASVPVPAGAASNAQQPPDAAGAVSGAAAGPAAADAKQPTIAAPNPAAATGATAAARQPKGAAPVPAAARAPAPAGAVAGQAASATAAAVATAAQQPLPAPPQAADSQSPKRRAQGQPATGAPGGGAPQPLATQRPAGAPAAQAAQPTAPRTVPVAPQPPTDDQLARATAALDAARKGREFTGTVGEWPCTTIFDGIIARAQGAGPPATGQTVLFRSAVGDGLHLFSSAILVHVEDEASDEPKYVVHRDRKESILSDKQFTVIRDVSEAAHDHVERAWHDRLGRLGLARLQVDGNGNCMFNSVVEFAPRLLAERPAIMSTRAEFVSGGWSDARALDTATSLRRAFASYMRHFLGLAISERGAWRPDLAELEMAWVSSSAIHVPVGSKHPTRDYLDRVSLHGNDMAEEDFAFIARMLGIIVVVHHQLRPDPMVHFPFTAYEYASNVGGWDQARENIPVIYVEFVHLRLTTSLDHFNALVPVAQPPVAGESKEAIAAGAVKVAGRGSGATVTAREVPVADRGSGATVTARASGLPGVPAATPARLIPAALRSPDRRSPSPPRRHTSRRATGSTGSRPSAWQERNGRSLSPRPREDRKVPTRDRSASPPPRERKEAERRARVNFKRPVLASTLVPVAPYSVVVPNAALASVAASSAVLPSASGSVNPSQPTAAAARVHMTGRPRVPAQKHPPTTGTPLDTIHSDSNAEAAARADSLAPKTGPTSATAAGQTPSSVPVAAPVPLAAPSIAVAPKAAPAPAVAASPAAAPTLVRAAVLLPPATVQPPANVPEGPAMDAKNVAGLRARATRLEPLAAKARAEAVRLAAESDKAALQAGRTGSEADARKADELVEQVYAAEEYARNVHVNWRAAAEKASAAEKRADAAAPVQRPEEGGKADAPAATPPKRDMKREEAARAIETALYDGIPQGAARPQSTDPVPAVVVPIPSKEDVKTLKTTARELGERAAKARKAARSLGTLATRAIPRDPVKAARAAEAAELATKLEGEASVANERYIARQQNKITQPTGPPAAAGTGGKGKRSSVRDFENKYNGSSDEEETAGGDSTPKKAPVNAQASGVPGTGGRRTRKVIGAPDDDTLRHLGPIVIPDEEAKAVEAARRAEEDATAAEAARRAGEDADATLRSSIAAFDAAVRAVAEEEREKKEASERDLAEAEARAKAAAEEEEEEEDEKYAQPVREPPEGGDRSASGHEARTGESAAVAETPLPVEPARPAPVQEEDYATLCVVCAERTKDSRPDECKRAWSATGLFSAWLLTPIGSACHR